MLICNKNFILSEKEIDINNIVNIPCEPTIIPIISSDIINYIQYCIAPHSKKEIANTDIIMFPDLCNYSLVITYVNNKIKEICNFNLVQKELEFLRKYIQ